MLDPQIDSGITTTTQQAQAQINRQSALDHLLALLGGTFRTAKVTTEYGAPSALSGMPHTGVDLSAAEWTPIQEPIGGTVERVWSDNVGGNQVAIRTPSGYTEVYAHLAAIPAFLTTTSGAAVDRGGVIGYVGSSGQATGPHLHYEVVKPGGKVGVLGDTLDPLAFIGEFAAPGGAPGQVPVFRDPATEKAVADAQAAAAKGQLGNPLDALGQIAQDVDKIVGDLTDSKTWARVGLTLVGGALIILGVFLYVGGPQGVARDALPVKA